MSTLEKRNNLMLKRWPKIPCVSEDTGNQISMSAVGSISRYLIFESQFNNIEKFLMLIHNNLRNSRHWYVLKNVSVISGMYTNARKGFSSLENIRNNISARRQMNG